MRRAMAMPCMHACMQTRAGAAVLYKPRSRAAGGRRTALDNGRAPQRHRRCHPSFGLPRLHALLLWGPLAHALEVEAGTLEGHLAHERGEAAALRGPAAVPTRAGAAAGPAAGRRAEGEAAEAAAAAALQGRRHVAEVQVAVPLRAVANEQRGRQLHEGHALLVGFHGLASQHCLDVARHAIPLRLQLGKADEGLPEVRHADAEDLRLARALEKLVHHHVALGVEHGGAALQELGVRPLVEGGEVAVVGQRLLSALAVDLQRALLERGILGRI
mmetsp:Transcript_22366/g.70485  ORF Transcript_22366/g.70485 Transcript_22366/m.70485 type:complete len:273 (-) Transcript_22366:666-1484(-)